MAFATTLPTVKPNFSIHAGPEALDRHGVVGQHAFAAGGIMLFEQLHAGLGGEQDWKMC